MIDLTGGATAHFAPDLRGAAKPAAKRGRYPAWVARTFAVCGFLALINLVGLIFAPLSGSVPAEMFFAIVLALALLGMAAAVRRVAIIRARR